MNPHTLGAAAILAAAIAASTPATAQAIYRVEPHTGAWYRADPRAVESPVTEFKVKEGDAVKEIGGATSPVAPPLLSGDYPKSDQPTYSVTEQHFANGETERTVLGSDGSSLVIRGWKDSAGEIHGPKRFTPPSALRQR